MIDQEVQIKRFAEALTKLAELVPATQEELTGWYRQARSLESDYLLSPGGLSQYMPEFLWHYLSDADIRMKDRSYAAIQDRRINLFIQQLKRGVLPAEDDI